MTAINLQTDRPRFRKVAGGEVLDDLTGKCVATVNVRELDTALADRVSNIIIDALHSEFGPRPAQKAAWA